MNWDTRRWGGDWRKLPKVWKRGPDAAAGGPKRPICWLGANGLRAAGRGSTKAKDPQDKPAGFKGPDADESGREDVLRQSPREPFGRVGQVSVQILLLFLEPGAAFAALALGTMAVAAGIVQHGTRTFPVGVSRHRTQDQHAAAAWFHDDWDGLVREILV